MEILFNNGLCEREFGSAVLHVPGLLTWAASKGFGLRTDPPIDSYDYVQVESLLCAIERSVYSETPETIKALMKRNPALKPDMSEETSRMEPEAAEAYLAEMDDVPVWYVGASTHLEWRKILSAAFEADALQLLAYNSLLPIAPAAKMKADTSPSGDEIPGKMPRTNIGKLAIKAAWQIECDTSKLATPKQVIEKLQAWTETEPELAETIPHGVKWTTTKGKQKPFDIEACAKALETWQASRA